MHFTARSPTFLAVSKIQEIYTKCWDFFFYLLLIHSFWTFIFYFKTLLHFNIFSFNFSILLILPLCLWNGFTVSIFPLFSCFNLLVFQTTVRSVRSGNVKRHSHFPPHKAEIWMDPSEIFFIQQGYTYKNKKDCKSLRIKKGRIIRI